MDLILKVRKTDRQRKGREGVNFTLKTQRLLLFLDSSRISIIIIIIEMDFSTISGVFLCNVGLEGFNFRANKVEEIDTALGEEAELNPTRICRIDGTAGIKA